MFKQLLSLVKTTMKKYLLIAGFALTAASMAWGKPALRIPLTVTQPDGSKLTIVKRGNAACKSIYTLDGYLLKRDDHKGYVYALPQDDGSLVASDILARNAEYRTDSELKFLSTVSREETNAAVAAMRIKAVDANRFMLKSRVPAFAQDDQKATRGPGLYDYSFPCKGKQKVLVILAEFKDVKFNSKNKSPYNKIDSKTYFTEMLNKDGFNTYGGTGSAHDWFIQNSKGLFDPEFDVYGPVTLPQNVRYYGQNVGYNEDDDRPYQMVIDACKALDNEINFKDYDRDGDGYVDNVYVFYAGYGEADTVGQEDTIWPHSWEISSATAPNEYFQGEPLKLDGVNIDRYACSNETCGIIGTNGFNYVYANRPDGIGTFVHEFSHLMGLPDLYSTADYSSDDHSGYMKVPFTPEEFSVMDYGPYNNDGMTPPNYSAYERYALDWMTPEEMTSGNKSLGNLEDTNQAFIVKTDKDQEFYLFENRQLKGWDTYIPASGMLVWHVDFEKKVFENNEVNNTKGRQYVDLVEADGIQDYPIGEDYDGYYDYPASTRSGDPFPGSANVRSFGASTSPALKSWSGKSLGVELSDIIESNGMITFTAVVDGSGVNDIISDTEILSGDIYDLRGVKVGTVVDGMVPALDAGIYIVRSGNKLNKIAVR